MAGKLIIVADTDKLKILKTLGDQGIDAVHCTNGTYAYDKSRVVPTTLAGFQYVADVYASPKDAFLVAVNSSNSMSAIMDAKEAPALYRQTIEDQWTRARKAYEPLAAQFPDRNIAVVFYDEETPTALYDCFLEDSDLVNDGEFLRLKSLHKWGYGTDPAAPRIEGAHDFENVIGFPLPNDVKPICHNITAIEDQSAFVRVVDLRTEFGKHGQPYITTDGKLRFDVPKEFTTYQAADSLRQGHGSPVPQRF